MTEVSNFLCSRVLSVRRGLVPVILALTLGSSEQALGQTTPFQYRSAGMVHESFTFDGDKVWTVEDGGRIRYRSSAGGAWNFQTVPTEVKEMLRHIHFVPEAIPADGPTGWAVGDKGWIIKTTDGGTNWFQTDFVTATGSSPQVPAVLTSPPPYAPPYEQLYDIFFLDEQRGWLCGLHGIWRTINGGQTWTACTLWMQNDYRFDGTIDQDFLSEIEFYSLDVVDRSGGTFLGLASAEPGLVFKTTNGTDWKVVLDIRCLCEQASGTCLKPAPPWSCTSCYDCTSLPEIGGCLGEPTAPETPQAQMCQYSICDAEQPAAFEMWDVEISRHATQKLAIACGGVGTNCGMVFSTTDDGTNWKLESHECQSTGLPGGVDCSDTADTGFLYHDIPEPPPPIAVNDPWWTHTFRLKTFPTVYGIAVFGADNSVIGSGYSGEIVVRDPVNGVWKDRSSFNHRIHQVDNAVTMPLNSATANTNGGQKGIIVGFGGTLLETATGGQTWTQPQNAEHCTPWRIRDLHFVDSAAGFQAGEFSRIGKTINEGIRWTTNSDVPDLFGATLFSIVFASTQRGVAVGAIQSGSTLPRIVLTLNQGATLWTAVSPSSIALASGGQPGALKDVCSGVIGQTGATYWAVGSNDFILKSVDNGTTWAQIRRGILPSQNMTVTLRGVALKDNLTGIVVGDGVDPQPGASRALAYQYRRGATPTWSEISPATGSGSSLSDVVISGNSAFAVGEKTVGTVRTGIVVRSDWSATTGFSAFAPLTDSPVGGFPLCTSNNSADLGATLVLLEVEIDALNSDLWIGGQCGRVWRRTSGGTWSVFEQTQTDTHIEGISVGDSSNVYFDGLRRSQPQQCVVRYHPGS